MSSYQSRFIVGLQKQVHFGFGALVGLGLRVGAQVGFGVGAEVALGVGAEVGLGVGVGRAVGVGNGVGLGVGVASIASAASIPPPAPVGRMALADDSSLDVLALEHDTKIAAATITKAAPLAMDWALVDRAFRFTLIPHLRLWPTAVPKQHDRTCLSTRKDDGGA